MSKIQAIFNGTGRELRDTERPSMEAFVARYQGTLTTPPGIVRIVLEKSKSRQVGVNGQVVKGISSLDVKKPRGKSTVRRKKQGRAVPLNFLKKTTSKA